MGVQPVSSGTILCIEASCECERTNVPVVQMDSELILLGRAWLGDLWVWLPAKQFKSQFCYFVIFFVICMTVQ